MSDQRTTVKVGFNQQQRQLLERLKAEGTFGSTEAEILQRVFEKWLEDEGLSAK